MKDGLGCEDFYLKPREMRELKKDLTNLIGDTEHGFKNEVGFYR